MRDHIPFVDVIGQTLRLEDELMGAIRNVVESGTFIGGPDVSAFEREFAAALGLADGVGCSSGTSALSLALEAAGIGTGAEVIAPAHTFFATAEAICHVGAKPVFVDIESGSYTIDPVEVEAAVTDRTRAVIAVHLYGTPADMDRLVAVCRRHRLILIEDAAQAHLASYRSAYVGALGDAAAFSFYPAKNLGAFGDAGFVTSRDSKLLAKVAELADHGRVTKYEHAVIGYNHRLDTVQAAVLRVKLRHLAAWNTHRRAIAKLYDSLLTPTFKVIEPTAGSKPVYHLYVVEVSNRKEVMDALKVAHIGCGIHYPVPLHLQPAMGYLGYSRGDLPKSEHAAARVISLPIDSEIDRTEVERVCEVFTSVARP